MLHQMEGDIALALTISSGEAARIAWSLLKRNEVYIAPARA
jgi:hypothetical protein